MSSNQIPYKIYLDESEMPKQWYNLRADMINKPAPLLNPETMKPITAEELSKVFCDELVKQELDETTPYIDIPEKILNFPETVYIYSNFQTFVELMTIAVLTIQMEHYS